MNGYQFTTETEDSSTIGTRTPRTKAESTGNASLADLTRSPFFMSNLCANKSSDVAGIAFDTPERGRQVCLYYQNEDAEIIQAHLQRKRTSAKWEKVTIAPIDISFSPPPKVDSPLAAVTELNGQNIRVFYLTNERNFIEEVISTDGGRNWRRGHLGERPWSARWNSDLAAALSQKNGRETNISLYFQDNENMIREVKWSENDSAKWDYGGVHGKAYGGSKLLAAKPTHSSDLPVVFYQKGDGKIVMNLTTVLGGLREASPLHAHFSGFTHNEALKIYVRDKENRILLESCGCFETGAWNDSKELPFSHYLVKEKFVALYWMLDNGEADAHIFSVEESKIYVFITEEGTPVPASMEIDLAN